MYRSRTGTQRISIQIEIAFYYGNSRVAIIDSYVTQLR